MLQLPIGRQVVVELQGVLRQLDIRAAADIERERALRGAQEGRVGLRTGHRAVMLVDARHANDVAVGVIGQRQTQVEDDVVVDVLDVEIDRAALERAAHSEAQLSALVRGVTGVADAIVLAVETADADAPIADWRREPAVEAPQAVVAGLELDDCLRARHRACV